MTVYVDDAYDGPVPAAHMTADSVDELHAMAARLGLRRSWFRPATSVRKANYVVSEGRRKVAVRMGAVRVDEGFWRAVP